MSDASRTSCPRCGHDVGGVVSSWTDACPLFGTCQECGLSFAWSELFSGRLNPPRWLFEHAPAWRTPIALVVTAFAAFAPWKLWDRVRMVHPIRAARCGILAVLPIIGAYVIGAGSAMREMNAALNRMTTMYPGTTISIQERGNGLGQALLLPTSDVPVVVQVLTPAQRANMLWSAGIGYGRTLTPPPAVATTGSVLVSVNVGTPWALWARSVSMSTLGLAVAPAAGVLASALAFAALPIARRRAKVLWRHVFRTAAYGLAAAPIVIAIAVVFGEDAISVGLVGFLFLALFWSGTVRVYLRMQRPNAVAFSVATIGALALLIELVVFTRAWERLFLRYWG